jgi:hypothetical protein
MPPSFRIDTNGAVEAKRFYEMVETKPIFSCLTI